MNITDFFPEKRYNTKKINILKTLVTIKENINNGSNWKCGEHLTCRMCEAIFPRVTEDGIMCPKGVYTKRYLTEVLNKQISLLIKSLYVRKDKR